MPRTRRKTNPKKIRRDNMSVHKYKTIMTRATQIKEEVLKYYEIKHNKAWSYFHAKSILNPKKDLNKIPIKQAKSEDTGDKFNRRITKNQFTNMAERFTAYVEKNHQLPVYITVTPSNRKMCVNDYTFMFARINVFYQKYGELPNSIEVNSKYFSKPKKKYGHATQSGCDNRGQNNSVFCGCHSLQEVFRNLTGIVVPQSTIAEWAGTTSSGTDHDGLNFAVETFNRRYDQNLKAEWKNFSDLGWTGIKSIVNSTNKDCVIHNLYRNQWGHYEVVNKVYDDYCDVQNSLGDSCGSCYCGYVEERYLSTFRSYISGISQKSVMVITNEG